MIYKRQILMVITYCMSDQRKNVNLKSTEKQYIPLTKKQKLNFVLKIVKQYTFLKVLYKMFPKMSISGHSLQLGVHLHSSDRIFP